ncbi:MAG: hypothetical protein J6P02_06090 [Lachnospiraceae bacterium]|nr:hypothetical protein [Lachnospiraceae bacterium]
MRKSTRIVKRLLALFLVVLMSINTFGAVVGDNDGSAFITKAEFDSLKNDFQSQIDNYNTSIDSKIDGAIASYLSGIQVAKETQAKCPVTNYEDMKWVKKWFIKGDYIKWVDDTAANTVKETDVWFEPVWNTLFGFRNRDFSINVSGGRGNYTLWSIYLGGKWYVEDNQTVSILNTVERQNGTPAAAYLDCKYDTVKDVIVLTDTDVLGWFDCAIERYFGGFIQLNPYSSTDGGTTWSGPGGQGQPIRPLPDTHAMVGDWLKFNELSDNEVLNLEVLLEGAGTNQVYKVPISYKYWEMAFNIVWWAQQWTKNGPHGPNLSPRNLNSCSPGVWTKNPTGLYNWGTDNDVAINQIKHLALSSDDEKIVNIRRHHDYRTVGSNESFEVRNDLSESFDFYVRVSTCAANAMRDWTINDHNWAVPYSESNIKTMKVKLYYPEKIDLRKISNGSFYNGEVPLKIGEGLPLISTLGKNEGFVIEFDYEFSRPWDTVPSTATTEGIRVDIKKSNYLNSTNDYYSGTINDGTSVTTLKNALSNKTSNHCIITVDKENITSRTDTDGVWLRIKPEDDTEGLAVSIKNLKIKTVA